MLERARLTRSVAMRQPRAYLNGQFVDASQAVVSVVDGGFLQGTTVAEQLRTFGGKLFRLEAHLERLFQSLAIVGVDPGLSARELGAVASELAGHNHQLLADGDDLGLTMFVTPGILSSAGLATQPTLCLHTLPLRFEQWAEKYDRGESLCTTSIAQVSEHSWPRELKCRSRMHYYLADREARARDPGSRALMRDDRGYVTEATTANVVLYDRTRGLRTPPREKVLPGISLGVLEQLASELGIPCVHQDLRESDVAGASEVFLTSTSPCALPVVRFNGQPIGTGKPGPAYAQLMSAWSRLVGLDIQSQARRFAAR
jgi:branched-chain amino acid aminotransferase